MKNQRFAPYSGVSVGSAIGFVGVFLAAMPIDGVLANWTLPDSMIFGLLSATIGIAWDIRKDVQRTSTARDRGTRLMQALEESDLHEEPLVGLVEAASKVRNMQLGEFTQKTLDGEVRDLGKRLDTLAEHQELSLDGESRLLEYMNGFTRETNRKLHATSAIDGVDEAFWASGSGKDYLAQQKARIDDGVEIRRIFFTQEHAMPPAVIDWMRQQEEAGIKIGALLEASRIDDFVIYDDWAVINTRLLSSGRGVDGGKIYFRETEIATYSTKYDQWWGRASRTWIEIQNETSDITGREAP